MADRTGIIGGIATGVAGSQRAFIAARKKPPRERRLLR
jgi:hypothetical protein